MNTGIRHDRSVAGAVPEKCPAYRSEKATTQLRRYKVLRALRQANEPRRKLVLRVGTDAQERSRMGSAVGELKLSEAV
jgi:hypothetical protein